HALGTRMTTQRLPRRFLFALAMAGVLALVLACVRYGAHRLSSRHRPNAPTYAAVGGLGPAELRPGPPAKPGRRILLDRAALAHLRESARAETPAFRYVMARCDEALARPVDSGYQGFEWADAVANLALAWHATGDARYADGAVRYLRALLDDRL